MTAHPAVPHRALPRRGRDTARAQRGGRPQEAAAGSAEPSELEEAWSHQQTCRMRTDGRRWRIFGETLGKSRPEDA